MKRGGGKRSGAAAAYVIDTNFYIRAFREAAFGEWFRSWHREALARLAMSAVVLHELLVGALDDQRRHMVESVYAGAFRRRDRLILPSERTWSRAAESHRAIRGMGGFDHKLKLRSFANDLLIAHTCREVGATLVTANSEDFDLIRRVTGVRSVFELPDIE